MQSGPKYYLRLSSDHTFDPAPEQTSAQPSAEPGNPLTAAGPEGRPEHWPRRSNTRVTVAPKAFMEEGRDIVRNVGGGLNKLINETENPKQTCTFANLSYDKDVRSAGKGGTQ